MCVERTECPYVSRDEGAHRTAGGAPLGTVGASSREGRGAAAGNVAGEEPPPFGGVPLRGGFADLTAARGGSRAAPGGGAANKPRQERGFMRTLCGGRGRPRARCVPPCGGGWPAVRAGMRAPHGARRAAGGSGRRHKRCYGRGCHWARQEPCSEVHMTARAHRGAGPPASACNRKCVCL